MIDLYQSFGPPLTDSGEDMLDAEWRLPSTSVQTLSDQISGWFARRGLSSWFYVAAYSDGASRSVWQASLSNYTAQNPVLHDIRISYLEVGAPCRIVTVDSLGRVMRSDVSSETVTRLTVYMQGFYVGPKKGLNYRG